MTPNRYQRLALRTVNKLLDDRDQVINAALGLVGESGEFADIVKKWTMQGHILNRTLQNKLKTELGDILWYVSVAAAQFGWKLDDIMAENIEKLKKRYPNGFEPKRSMRRKT